MGLPIGYAGEVIWPPSPRYSWRMCYPRVLATMTRSDFPGSVEDGSYRIGKDLKTIDEVKETPQPEALFDERHAVASETQRHSLSRKAELSAYMAIAASAFGLISDGCEPAMATMHPFQWR